MRLLLVALLAAISYAQTEMVAFVLGDNDESIPMPVDDMDSESGRRFLQDTDVTEPTGVDQLMLELINACRADPQAMADYYLSGNLNENLPSDTLTADSKAPLAWNIDLWEAAHDHNVWMYANTQFSYTGEGDSQPTQRMQEAGYVLTSPWSTAENIAYSGSIYDIEIVEFTEKNHRNLIQSPGHRLTFMRDTWKEVGLSNVEGDFNGYNAVMTTQDFALSGTDVFLTGVVYNDAVENNDFYDVGEGLGDITITAVDQQNAANTFTTQSFGAGGYSLIVDPNTNYMVTFSGDLQSDGTSTSQTYSVSMQEVNVKQDCVTNFQTTNINYINVGDGQCYSEESDNKINKCSGFVSDEITCQSICSSTDLCASYAYATPDSAIPNSCIVNFDYEQFSEDEVTAALVDLPFTECQMDRGTGSPAEAYGAHNFIACMVKEVQYPSDAFVIEESTSKSSKSTIIWISIALAASILFCSIVILIAYRRKYGEEVDNVDPPKLDDNLRTMTMKANFSELNLGSEEGIIQSDSPRETKIAVEMEYQSQKRKISEI